MPTYDGIGETITHEIEVVGDVFISNVEGGSLSTQVPFEIFSNVYGMATPPTDSRQVRLRVQPSTEASPDDSYVTDMGIQNTTDNYFFITAPQNTSTVGDQNTFVISKTSNVGIGTTGPQQPLHVVGNILATGTISALDFIGSGDGINDLNASNITSGTLNNNRLPGTISVSNIEATANLVVGGPVDITGTLSAAGITSSAAVNVTGTVSASGALEAAKDSNTTSFLGRAAVGYNGFGDWATFAHIDHNNTTGYAVAQSNSGGTVLNRPTGTNLTFRENDDVQVKLLSGGNLGIGTDSPSELLHVNSGNVLISQSVGQIQFSESATDPSGTGNVVLRYDGAGTGANNKFYIASEYSTWPQPGSGFTYVPSNGRVGIGTDSPSKKLTIKTNWATTDYDGIFIKDNNDNFYVELGAVSTDAGISKSAGYMRLHNTTTNVTDGILLNGTGSSYINGGNVGIGTTDPSYMLDVNGTVRGVDIVSTGSAKINGASASGELVTRGNAGTAFVIQRTGVAWTTTMGMTNISGHLQVVNNSNGVQLNKNATSWSAISDERFKKNITILENNLDVISNIRCVSFNYKHEDDSMQKRIGFIAQDWLKVLPEIVDSNGADEEDGSEEKYLLRSVDAIPVLCGAIKELLSKVETLEARIEALENSS